MSRHRLSNKVFLVVDDDQPQLKLIGKILQKMGAVRIVYAINGPDALDLFLQSRIDFIITDLRMSPMDGFELSRRVRSMEVRSIREVPIIVSTGYSTRGNVENARDAGVTEVLRKPYMPIDLFHRVLSVLDQPRQFIARNAFNGPDRRRRLEVLPDLPERRSPISVTSTLRT